MRHEGHKYFENNVYYSNIYYVNRNESVMLVAYIISKEKNKITTTYTLPASDKITKFMPHAMHNLATKKKI